MRNNPLNKILITGGSGYIGSVLIDTLKKKGIPLRIIDIAPLSKDLINKKVEFVLGDIRDVSNDIFHDISSVIHLAGISNDTTANRNPQETKDVNTTATTVLAKKAKKAGVGRFIFASSSSIYDLGIHNERGAQKEEASVSPSGLYSISKYEAEKALLTLSNSDFVVVILRKATVCGFSPVMRFDLVVNAMIRNVIEKGCIRVFCKGVQWRPLISVHDVAMAYYKTLIVPTQRVNGQIFNIGLNNLKVADIAILVQKTLRKHFSLNPPIVFEQDGKEDRSYRIIVDKAKKSLRFTAKVSIEDTIVNLYKNLRRGDKSEL